MLAVLTALPLILLTPDDLAARADQYARAAPEQRIRLLEEVAELHSASDVAAVAVTEFVTRGLADDSFLVRARAADLLAAGLEHDVAMRALLDAAGVFEEQRKAALEVVRRQQDVMRDRNNRMPADEARALLERVRREYETQSERIEGYRYALTDALAERRDARSVSGITTLFAQVTTGERADPCIDALLGLGTREALERLVTIGVGTYASRLRTLQDRLASELAAVPGKRRDLTLSDEEWERRERARLAVKVRRTRADLEQLERWGGGFEGRLRDFVAAHELGAAPTALVLADWTEWLSAARSKLPETPETPETPGR